MSLSFSLFLRGIQTTTEFTNASPPHSLPSLFVPTDRSSGLSSDHHYRNTYVDSDAEDTRKGEPDGDSKRWRLDG